MQKLNTNQIFQTFMVLTLGFVPVMTTAAEENSSYLALRTSLGLNIFDNMSHNGTVGTGQQIGPFIDGRLDDDRIDDYTAGIGAAYGRDIGPWRLEAELIWRYRSDWDMVMPTPSIQAVTNSFTNVGSTTLMLNGARTGKLAGQWRWQAGVGIGVVYNQVEATFIEREGPNGRPELKLKDRSNHTDFSWNVFTGVSRPLGEKWLMHLQLRYIELGELEAGPFRGRDIHLSADHRAPEFQFSFGRRW